MNNQYRGEENIDLVFLYNPITQGEGGHIDIHFFCAYLMAKWLSKRDCNFFTFPFYKVFFSPVKNNLIQEETSMT